MSATSVVLLLTLHTIANTRCAMSITPLSCGPLGIRPLQLLRLRITKSIHIYTKLKKRNPPSQEADSVLLLEISVRNNYCCNKVAR